MSLGIPLAEVVSATPLPTSALGKVDLAIAIDTTASMGAYIEAAKECAHELIRRVAQEAGVVLRVGVVAYRDYCDEHATYLTRVLDLTSDTRAIHDLVASLAPAGGGDVPEAVDAAFRAARDLSWGEEKDTTRVLAVITDAPPHGLGEGHYDSLSQGTAHLAGDPLALADALADKKVRTYAVLAPTLRGTRGEAFFRAVCDKTGGRALRLGDTHALAQCLLGGVVEESATDHLAVVMGERLDERLQSHPDETPTEREAAVFRSLSDVTLPRLDADEVAETPTSASLKTLSCLPPVPDLGVPRFRSLSALDDPPTYRSLSALDDPPTYRSLSALDDPPTYRSIDASSRPPLPIYHSFDASPPPTTLRTATATPEVLQRALRRVVSNRV
jgi:Mg-chelatase subunit ChlD